MVFIGFYCVFVSPNLKAYDEIVKAKKGTADMKTKQVKTAPGPVIGHEKYVKPCMREAVNSDKLRRMAK